MDLAKNSLLDFKIGSQSIKQRLQQAVVSGYLFLIPDGSYRLFQQKTGVSPWITVSNGPPLNCKFLMGFVFEQAYGREQVPFGCSSCYKVMVRPRTVAELMALKDLQAALNFDVRAKCGVSPDCTDSQDAYYGYFYCDSLQAAEHLHQRVRQAIDCDLNLGPEVPTKVIRGCKEYEIACGPWDQMKFPSELEAIEKKLKQHYSPLPAPSLDPRLARLSTLVGWMKTAARIGDLTYLKFSPSKNTDRKQ